MNTIPFGKYTGKLLDEVPRVYLQWMLYSARAAHPDLRKAIADFLGVDLPPSPNRYEGYNSNNVGIVSSNIEVQLKSRINKLEAEISRMQEEIKDLQSSKDERENNLPSIRDIIKSWYRRLTLVHHPDRTLGDSSAMKKVIEEYESICKLLEVTK